MCLAQEDGGHRMKEIKDAVQSQGEDLEVHCGVTGVTTLEVKETGHPCPG